MESLKLVRENVLTFKRLIALNVTGYNIVVKETLADGSISKYVLENIVNPRTPQPVLHKMPLDYVKNQTWKLPNDLYVDSEHGIKVFINGIILSPLQYNFSEKLKQLTLMEVIRNIDTIELEYFKDEVTYKHKTSNHCEYFIEPTIVYAHNMGDHNIIK